MKMTKFGYFQSHLENEHMYSLKVYLLVYCRLDINTSLLIHEQKAKMLIYIDHKMNKLCL